ncbi:hypothetical protein [Halomonas sp.]|nr:hypothetical protein [Halomonas sp.]
MTWKVEYLASAAKSFKKIDLNNAGAFVPIWISQRGRGFLANRGEGTF